MTKNNKMPAPRAIDHCVLPTADLETARARLAALGFTVAPDGAHPFGTGNACVYLADGTFLEPLAVVDPEAARVAADSDNVFLARDRAFRAAHGEEGFSALVMGTTDASADHSRFLERGISAGPDLFFSRPFTDAGGKQGEASFRLAFAAPGPEGAFFFTCERVATPQVDRAALERHANGVSGIARVVLVADDASAHRDLLAELTQAPDIEEFVGGTDFHAANGLVCLLNESGMKAMLGLAPEEGAGLQLTAIVLRTDSLEKVETCFADAGIAVLRHAGWLVVEPAEGQGAILAFEEAG